jgi:hypothetical protein
MIYRRRLPDSALPYISGKEYICAQLLLPQLDPDLKSLASYRKRYYSHTMYHVSLAGHQRAIFRTQASTV